MTLKRQTYTLALKGLNTGVDPKALTPGELVLLENGVFDKGGVIKKRKGYDVRSPVGLDARTISKGRLLAAVEDELLLFADTATGTQHNGAAVLSLDEAGGGKWTPIGRSNPVEVNVKEVAAPADLSQVASYNVMPYMAAVGDYDLVASEVRAGSLAGYYLSVTNRATGATVYNQRVRSSGTTPKICATGDYAAISVIVGGQIYIDVWSAADPDTVTLAGAGTITDLNGAGNWDVCEIGAFTFAIAYRSTTGTALRIRVIDTTGGAISIAATTSATSNTQQNVVSIHKLTVSGSSTIYLLVMWQDSSAASERLRYALFTYTVATLAFTLESGPADLHTSDLTGEVVRNATAALDASTGSANTVRWFAEVQGNASYHARILTGSSAFPAMAGSVGVSVRHIGLASKAFTYNGGAWVWAAHESSLQASYFLMNRSASGFLTPAGAGVDYDAKVLYGRGGGLTYRSGLPAVVDRGNATFATAMLKQTQTTNGGLVVRVPVVAAVNMDPPAPRVVTAGRAAFVAGGFVGQAAGKFHEVGHHLYPENLAVSAAVAGGLANGAYQIAATYKWVDPLGETHESAPSPVLAYTVAGGNGTLTVTCPSLAQASRFVPDTLGNDKASDTFVQFYMSEVGLSVLYQLQNAAVINDPDANTVQVTINTAPTTTYPVLPTTGGVLDTIAPPCMLDLTEHRNRLAGIPADDRTADWYTKPKIRGAGYEWSDELLVRIDSHGDDTALAGHDDKLFVFKRKAIYAISGEGADDTGSGGFSTPYLVVGDVGCAERASVLVTPAGIVFKSLKGFYLMGRGYIGGPVQKYDQYEVRAAVLEEDEHRAIFFLSDEQPALVWDYLADQWGTYTDHEAVAATVWKGKLAWVDADARVHVQSDGYTDDGKAYPLKLGLGWITMAGGLGWQRFIRFGVLCDWKSPHTLMLRVYYRRGEVPEDRGTVVTDDDGVECVRFDLTMAAERVSGGHLVRARFPHQKATAVRVEIEDTDPSGEDYTISALLCEVAVKPGVARLPAEKTA